MRRIETDPGIREGLIAAGILRPEGHTPHPAWRAWDDSDFLHHEFASAFKIDTLTAESLMITTALESMRLFGVVRGQWEAKRAIIEETRRMGWLR